MRAVSVLLIVFGAFMALLNSTALFAPINKQVDRVFWGDVGPDAVDRQFQAWAYGVLGATTMGWGIFLYFVASHPFRKKERWARDCVLLGLGSWFVLDTGISAYYGVTLNVLINTALFILAMVPVALTFREFKR